MRRNAMRLFFFIFIGVVLMTPINKVYIETNGYRHLNDTDKFMNVPKNLDIINLGSSHGLNGFEYDDTGVNGYNMALPAQGFYYDYRILMQYSDHLNDNAVVLIPVSYFAPYQSYVGEKFERFNMRYYRFMEAKYIRYFTPWDYLRYNKFPVLFAGDRLKYIFDDRATVQADWELIDYNTFGEENIAAEGFRRAKHHIDTIINVGQENKTLALAELKNAIEYCYENDLTPVLVTTPLHHEYKIHFETDFLNEFASDIEMLQDQYTGLMYFDYSEFNATDTSMFMNADHLNSVGRKVFSDYIIKDLQERDVLVK